MMIQSAEHLTRYTLFFEKKQYMRIVEEGIDGETVTWLLMEGDIDGGAYMMVKDEYHSLEQEFLKALN
tara:strand:+ start:1004 stop:1207 length:204 start_codon:yes stop_codon:yes gene_type:complete